MLLRLIVAIVGLIVLAVVVVGVLAFFKIIPIPGLGGSKPENTAKFFPHDVVAYSWLTLNPGGGQRTQMLDAWERFDELDGFHDAVQDLMDEIEDDTGIYFEEDVLPWIGPDISSALLDASFDKEPEAVVILGVRDADAAFDFMDDFLFYWEGEEGTIFDEDTEGDFDLWLAEDDAQLYALSNDWLVFATTEDALFDVLDLMSGDGRRSLAENDRFQEARSALPERRFTSVFIDNAAASDAIGGLSPLGATQFGLGAGGFEIPDWTAISAQWVDRGLVIDTVTPTTTDFGLDVADLDDPGNILPDDSLGYLATTFDPNLDNWRAALDEIVVGDLWFLQEGLFELEYVLSDLGLGGSVGVDEDGTLADVLDLVLDYVIEFTGIDLERDFFDHLDGELIVNVRDFDFEDVADDPSGHPIDAVAMLSYKSNSKAALLNTMDEFAELVEDNTYGMLSADQVDVGAADDAVVFDLDPSGISGIAYWPGYVLHDGYLTLGTTEEALATVVDLQNGDGDNLESVDEYQRAMAHLPGQRQGLMFVDLQRIITQLDPDDLDMDFDTYEVFETGFSAVGISVHLGEEYTRSSFAMTLFPE